MPTRIVLNENGFSSCNQKALDSDLRRINLSQRQYVSNYHAERRKVITRFARKLMLTGLNTNFDINNFQSTPEEPRKKNKINLSTIIIDNIGTEHDFCLNFHPKRFCQFFPVTLSHVFFPIF